MKYFLIIGLIAAGLNISAQKKVVQVSQSALTGIALPVTSKKDSRMLVVFGAKILLEIESKKNGLSTGSTEVLNLPGLSASGFNQDSLKFQLSNLGWSINPLQNDPKYMWLQKDGRTLIAYFSTDNKKQSDLYIAETVQAAQQQQNTGTSDQSQNTGVQQQYPVDQSQNNNNQPQQSVQNDVPPQNNPDQNNNSTVQQPGTVPAVSSGTTGILVSTINFDDGWTAVPKEDWVEVSKNDITALLHYTVAVPDELKSGDEEPVLNYFWNKLIDPRFTATNIQKRPVDPASNAKIYFMEADATGKNSGQASHIAFRIFITNGVAICIEIDAASKSSYDAAFPDIELFKNMLNYNKFAVSPGDITGQWKESTGGFAGFYNAYTGGISAVPANNQLTLDEQGHFLLELKGNGETPQSFSESYNGTYTLSNWELVTTDQNAKTSQYNVFYMAVKNGRILYLQNKENSTPEYFMVKTQ